MRLCLALLLILSAVNLYIQGNTIKSKKKENNPARTQAVKENVIINNQTFYFGIDEFVEWNEAYDQCIDLGMQLLTLDTFEKQTMINEWLNLNPEYSDWLWTAGVKTLGTSEWQWITPLKNFTFSYTNWSEGQPSRDPVTDESCMNFSAWWGGGWDDDPCLGALIWMQYACEEIPV